MSDAFAGFVGIVLMIAFLLLIAVRLQELPVWIAFIVGVVLMLWGFWKDAFAQLFAGRTQE